MPFYSDLRLPGLRFFSAFKASGCRLSVEVFGLGLFGLLWAATISSRLEVSSCRVLGCRIFGRSHVSGCLGLRHYGLRLRFRVVG